LVDASDGEPGMLIPVLSSSSTNLPYVQQMDEYFQVTEMLPFLEYENYPLVAYNASTGTEIGDRGLVAFRGIDGSIFCGSTAEVVQQFERSKDEVRTSPHLYSQLLRIEGVELGSIYDAWRTVANATFEGEEQRRFWLESELTHFQTQREIWADIDSQREDDRSRQAFGLAEGLNTYSSEYLIRWLTNRKNFRCSDWGKIWHYVSENTPFDSRLFAIGLQWLYFAQAEGLSLSEAKSIVFALLQLAVFSNEDLRNFGTLLSDELSNDLLAIFGLLRPAFFLERLFVFLGAHGGPEDVLSIVRFVVSELPQEAYILDALRKSLVQLRTRLSDSEVLRLEVEELLSSIPAA
jgi:hypothetical protein